MLAETLAREGVEVIINYHDPGKEKRARKTQEEISAKGVNAYLLRADITTERETLIEEVKKLGSLDFLVLNAAGGLEIGLSEEEKEAKAREVNIEAQVDLAEKLLPLMKPGSVIVYITSHWAHRYGEEGFETPSFYGLVAKTKHECEERLVQAKERFQQNGVKLLILTGALTQDTGAYLLFHRQARLTEDKEAALKRLEEESIKLEKWGEVLRQTLKTGFDSGDVVYVDKKLETGFQNEGRTIYVQAISRKTRGPDGSLGWHLPMPGEKIITRDGPFKVEKVVELFRYEDKRYFRAKGELE